MVRSGARHALIFLLLVTLLPSAHAGVRITEVRQPEGLLEPGSGFGEVAVDVEVDCASIWNPQGLDTQMTFRFDLAFGMEIAGDALVMVPNTACIGPQGTIDGTFTFVASVTRDARALVALTGVVTVDIGANLAGLEPPGNASADFVLRADYLPLIASHTEVRAIETQGTGSWTILVENRGNGPTTVSFDVIEHPQRARLILPPPLELGWAGDGDGTWAQNVTVKAEIPQNLFSTEAKAFIIRLQATSTEDPARDSMEIQVGLLARSTPSGFWLIPVFAAVVLLGVGIGVLLYRRSRRS